MEQHEIHKKLTEELEDLAFGGEGCVNDAKLAKEELDRRHRKFTQTATITGLLIGFLALLIGFLALLSGWFKP